MLITKNDLFQTIVETFFDKKSRSAINVDYLYDKYEEKINEAVIKINALRNEASYPENLFMPIPKLPPQKHSNNDLQNMRQYYVFSNCIKEITNIVYNFFDENFFVAFYDTHDIIELCDRVTWKLHMSLFELDIKSHCNKNKFTVVRLSAHLRKAYSSNAIVNKGHCYFCGCSFNYTTIQGGFESAPSQNCDLSRYIPQLNGHDDKCASKCIRKKLLLYPLELGTHPNNYLPVYTFVPLHDPVFGIKICDEKLESFVSLCVKDSFKDVRSSVIFSKGTEFISNKKIFLQTLLRFQHQDENIINFDYLYEQVENHIKTTLGSINIIITHLKKSEAYPGNLLIEKYAISNLSDVDFIDWIFSRDRSEITCDDSECVLVFGAFIRRMIKHLIKMINPMDELCSPSLFDQLYTMITIKIYWELFTEDLIKHLCTKYTHCATRKFNKNRGTYLATEYFCLKCLRKNKSTCSCDASVKKILYFDPLCLFFVSPSTQKNAVDQRTPSDAIH